jgi:hypothetical protein
MKNYKKENLKALDCIKEGINFNMKTKNGFIYMVGGILSKLEGENHFIYIKDKWVLVSK